MTDSEDFTLIVRIRKFSPRLVSESSLCHFLENRALLPPCSHHKWLEILSLRTGAGALLYVDF